MEKEFEEMAQRPEPTPPEGFFIIPNLAPGYAYGKFYTKVEGVEVPELGFFIRPEHVRSKNGMAAGGILLTAADYLMGVVLFRKLFKSLASTAYHPTTVSMSTDFLSPVMVDDWVTAKVEILKVGRQVCSVQCVLYCKEKPILRASASYILAPKQ